MRVHRVHLEGVEPPIFPISLGTAEYGSRISVDDASALLDAFVGAGGNFIDTAHIYGAWDRGGVNGGCGNSEVVVGRWMKARGCRDQMIVGTKGGHPDFETHASGLTRPSLMRQLQESLDHLQTEVIDIYWLHRDDRDIPAEDILGWLHEPMAKGFIRAIGCSHWRTDRLKEARDAAAKLGLPMVQASQIRWCLGMPNTTRSVGKFGEQLLMDEDARAFHLREGMPLVAYGAQGGGLFADRCVPYALDDPSFPKPGLADTFGNRTTEARRRAAKQVAKRLACSVNQVAIAWLLHQPFPTVALVGPETIEQVQDAMGAAHIVLDATALARLSVCHASQKPEVEATA